MLVVGLVTGQLTAGLRFQARVATHREARSRALFEAARDLSNQLTQEQAVEVAQAVIAREFRAQAALFVLDAQDRLQPPRAAPDGATGLDLGTAQWALDHELPAGLGTDTLAGSAWLYLPLKAPMRSRGVLALKPDAPRLLLVPEQRQQLETFALLVAMALERVHYIDIAQQATVQMASERLRNSLLSALSHDLRTPLAGLVGLAESLQRSPPALSPEQQRLAASIVERTHGMADMVTNLLDMARIQSGEVRLRREWQSVEELIGSALHAAQAAWGPRRVTVQIAPGVPLVECDAVLIERVLANLLENAGKYTPPGTPLEIGARTVGGDLRISLSDHGPGVPAGQEEAIFEKFTRGRSESATPGMGLGLAICRAIVEAHGGRITVESAASGGATFSFSLPLGTPPAVDLADEATADLAPATGVRG
jgi:two-component system sensor histidine kinase KdpD